MELQATYHRPEDCVPPQLDPVMVVKLNAQRRNPAQRRLELINYAFACVVAKLPSPVV